MPKPLISIATFTTGVSPDQTDNSGFQTMYCLDPYTRPGVLRVMPRMDADDDTAVTELIRWFEAYDDGSDVFLYGYDEAGKIYYRDTGTWTLGHTAATADGQGLKAFATSLYYTTRGKLGQLNGVPSNPANYTDAFKSLQVTVGTTDYNPMVEFAGSLYIGNDRYVARLEADETTFDATALTLPVGYEVRAIEVWNDRIIIGTRSSTKVITEKIFIWDGLSPFWELAVDVPKPGATCFFNFNHALYAFIGSGLYVFNGAEFILQKQLPKTSTSTDADAVGVRPGAAELFNERMLFGTELKSGTLNTSLNGVWSLGRHSGDFSNALTFAFEASTGEGNDIEIGAVKVFGTNNDRPILYFSWQDNNASTVGVDVINYSRRYGSSAYLLTDAYEVGDSFGTLVQGVRLEFASDMTANNAQAKIVVKYRTDTNIDPENDTTNFTTLGTIDNEPGENDNQDDILYGIAQRCRRIQFKFEFTTASGNDTAPPEITRIHIY